MRLSDEELEAPLADLESDRVERPFDLQPVSFASLSGDDHVIIA